MENLIPTMPPPSAEPVNPFGLLSPVVQEMVSTISVLQQTITQERQQSAERFRSLGMQHAQEIGEKDAEHAAEVRGLTARLEAAEAELEVCQRDLDRMRTGQAIASGGMTVTHGAVTTNGTTLTEAGF